MPLNKATEKARADAFDNDRHFHKPSFEKGWEARQDEIDAKIHEMREALKEAGDVIECYHLNTGIDLGDASRMPFYKDTMSKILKALGDSHE